MKVKRSRPLSDGRLEPKGPAPEKETLEYCDVCFIAFGSQEPRLRKADKVFHRDCAPRA